MQSTNSSPERPGFASDEFPTPGRMALGTHLHKKPRGAVLGDEGCASKEATQKRETTPPRPVQFMPILKATGVNPDFVKMSACGLKRTISLRLLKQTWTN